ncbi:MAG: hypothetical protein M1828_002965 [Chrysothrix sp. TS-e1954]|nr:MAG: hypothetical protein M1828_002965 [Chrysothrix sp. TS-e1954]
MGKLIKNHLARLVVLAAATFQCAAAFECFFWPKIFFDFYTKNLDGAVKPVPILQTISMVLGLCTLLYEWPASFIAGLPVHRSIEVRLFWFPMNSLCCALMYQGIDPAFYYLIGIAIYFWAYTEGEVVCSSPWTLPSRKKGGAKV